MCVPTAETAEASERGGKWDCSWVLELGWAGGLRTADVSPSAGSRGRAPGGGLGRSPQKLNDYKIQTKLSKISA